MEELKKIEDLIDHAKEYVNTRIEEAKLASAEKTSKVIAMLIAAGILSLIFFISLLFASMAASYALDRLWGNAGLGFLLVGAAYFLLAILIWSARERLIRIPVMNAIIHQLFKTEDEDEKD